MEAVASVKEKLWNRDFILVLMANFMLFFAFYLLMPLLPLYLRDNFEASKQLIGVIMSGFTITALMVRPLSGYLVDTFPRKMVLLLAYGTYMIFFAGYLIAWSVMLFAVIRLLHGFSFGAVTVSNSTLAIDLVPSSRRAEAVGYYGMSNNLAMAIGPTSALYLFNFTESYNSLFMLSLIVAIIGFVIVTVIKAPKREPIKESIPITLDRFFLINGMCESIGLIFVSFAYGILATYLVIYAEEVLGIVDGVGGFFMLMAVGLILSRILNRKALYQGKLTYNVTLGFILVIVGLVILVLVHNLIGFYIAALVVGFGYGALCPAYQTMFINIAPNNRRGTANSTYLTSWDIGMGLGVLFGGMIADSLSYQESYIMAVVVVVIGTILFQTVIKQHFNKIKLR
ncbi:MAG: MFS transporter [Bacteroidales bacterium]